MTCNARQGLTDAAFLQTRERVIVEFGLGDPQLGEIITVSHHWKLMTVRLDEGIMGQGDLPLQWRGDNEYDLLAGGKVKVRKLL